MHWTLLFSGSAQMERPLIVGQHLCIWEHDVYPP
jgi:hypothetical protein